MPNADSLAAIGQMDLIQSVDDGRAANDPFKLPARLRTQLDADLHALEEADGDTALTESDRAGGSAAARAALTKLADFAREGFKFIDAIRSTKITDAQRVAVFSAYGWHSGKLGRLGDARVLGLSRLAVQPHTELAAEFRYPADLLADITAQLAVFDENAVAATGGEREVATRVRNEKLGAAETTLAQVRFAYCSASRDTDRTPELARINFQPRRGAGSVSRSEPEETESSSSSNPPTG